MNKFFSKPRYMQIAACCCGLLLLAACSPSGSGKSIENRASERWELMLNGNVAGAYEYLSPGYRSSVTSEAYQKLMLLKQVDWISAEYIESNCAENTCKVSILLGYALHRVLPGVDSFEGSQVIEESWIKSDDVWYLVPEQ